MFKDNLNTTWFGNRVVSPALALFILASVASVPTGAFAKSMECSFKQRFFESSGRGSLAYITNANSLSDARNVYSNWCNVADKIAIGEKKSRYLFAINNRSSVSKKGFYAVIKAFRRGRSSKIRPLLSFRRIGSWTDREGCSFGDFAIDQKGPSPRASVFEKNPVNRLANASYASGDCDMFNAWNGEAFGRSDLALHRSAVFLKGVPERVAFSDSREWSVSLTAMAYGTVELSNRTSRYPIVSITRDDASEVVIEYFDSDGVYRLFYITT